MFCAFQTFLFTRLTVMILFPAAETIGGAIHPFCLGHVGSLLLGLFGLDLLFLFLGQWLTGCWVGSRIFLTSTHGSSS